MPQIRHVHIKNFRAIKELVWRPRPGLNCLIGSGDSGKSTILDAIEIALSARQSYLFTDADFFKLDTTNPIEIFVTIGALDDELKNIDTYGMYLRGFDDSSGEILDEPQVGQEVVLTLKLTVEEGLDADWLLYSQRTSADDLGRRLPWKHRELIAPARLGTALNHHLAWGNRSVLNKLSEETFNVSSALAKIGRATRETFSNSEVAGVDELLTRVKTIANELGVPVGDLQAQLDVNSVSLSHGAISLHNDDKTPLRQLGTGSSRLLISGLQKAATTSSILLVDEAEYGLEPYRITRLLNELGSKEQEPEQQVFITTHSPYVLRELQANQLHVLNKLSQAEQVFNFGAPGSHRIHSLDGGEVEQSTLRVCAEAFFSRAVIVCEGKTEIGLIKGYDLYRQDQGEGSIQAHGVYWADGGGQTQFQRATIFRQLGYQTAILKDSDKSTEDITPTSEAKAIGINVFEWGSNFATEAALFSSCPESVIPDLIGLAIERKGRDSINSNIQKFSDNQFCLDNYLENFDDSMRSVLSVAANKKSWFKDIQPAETMARNIIGPNYSDFDKLFTAPINALFTWATAIGGQ